MVNMTLLFVRTMKSSVQAELTIPAQTRYVFPIHLGKVERHVSCLPANFGFNMYGFLPGLQRKP
jgi:hypothetical protein